jgi:hypothetical protein
MKSWLVKIVETLDQTVGCSKAFRRLEDIVRHPRQAKTALVDAAEFLIFEPASHQRCVFLQV